MKPSEIAQRAFNLIKDENNWLQGRFAEDELGLCDRYSDEACKFCSMGALMRVGHGDFDSTEIVYYYLSLQANSIDSRYDSPIFFNDNHTHELVCEMWEKTIDSLKSKGL